MLKLHIGCGERKLESFVNVDKEGNPDLKIDVRNGLPFPDESVDYVFSEHFIEHLTRDEGVFFLKEVYRVLKPAGVCRIATPDLDRSVQEYCDDSWRKAEWVERFDYEWIPNNCVMLNISFREWGHQYIYNEEDLRMVGNLSGFLLWRRQEVGQSSFSELRNLEHRAESLVMEYIKEATEYKDELPLVSICIPAYNPQFFKEALESAFNQTYLNFEIIVCDDSAGTEIQNIIRYFPEKCIRYYKNSENIGAWENFLKCLSVAEGKYIKCLNDDDLLHPDALKTMVSYFEAYGKRVSLITSKRDMIDEFGNRLPDIPVTRSLAPTDLYIKGCDLGNFVLEKQVNIIGEPTTVMFRKKDSIDFAENFARFYEGGEGIGDVLSWITLLGKGDAIYISQPLSFFRQHSKQQQRDPQNIFWLVRAWYSLVVKSRELGYLADPASWGTALKNVIAFFQAWLKSFPFEEHQRSEFQEILAYLEKELEALKGTENYSKQLLGYPIIRGDSIQKKMATSMQTRYQNIQHLIQNGHIDEAISALEDFTASFSNVAIAFNDLGVLYFLKGDILHALSSFDKCLRLDPQNLTALKNIRDIFVKLGVADEVLKISKVILALNPDDEETHKILQELSGQPNNIS